MISRSVFPSRKRIFDACHRSLAPTLGSMPFVTSWNSAIFVVTVGGLNWIIRITEEPPGLAVAFVSDHLIVAGTKDRLTPHTEGQKLAASVSGPCVLSVIEGGNHVVNNFWYRYRDQTADWMAAQLGAAKR